MFLANALDILHPIKYADSHPDSKVHGANMGPIWGRQDPAGPHVGPMNFAIWALLCYDLQLLISAHWDWNKMVHILLLN